MDIVDMQKLQEIILADHALVQQLRADVSALQVVGTLLCFVVGSLLVIAVTDRRKQ